MIYCFQGFLLIFTHYCVFYHLLALASGHWVAGTIDLRKIVERTPEIVKTCPLNLILPPPPTGKTRPLWFDFLSAVSQLSSVVQSLRSALVEYCQIRIRSPGHSYISSSVTPESQSRICGHITICILLASQVGARISIKRDWGDSQIFCLNKRVGWLGKRNQRNSAWDRFERQEFYYFHFTLRT